MVFAIKVLHVIRLSPCQPDHTFDFSTMIKVSLGKFCGLCLHYESCVIQSPTKSCVTTLLVNTSVMFTFQSLTIFPKMWQWLNSFSAGGKWLCNLVMTSHLDRLTTFLPNIISTNTGDSDLMSLPKNSRDQFKLSNKQMRKCQPTSHRTSL